MILYYPCVICTSLLNIDAIIILLFYYINAWTQMVHNTLRTSFRLVFSKYNLKSRGIDLEQPSYNNRFFIIRLPIKLVTYGTNYLLISKRSSKFSDFSRHLKGFWLQQNRAHLSLQLLYIACSLIVYLFFNCTSSIFSIYNKIILIFFETFIVLFLIYIFIYI